MGTITHGYYYTWVLTHTGTETLLNIKNRFCFLFCLLTKKVKFIYVIIIIINACVRIADVMTFTFVSLMPVHSVCRICKIIKE